jgi:flagellar hook-associated protein FlgK
MSVALSIGLSGLTANQSAIDITGQNISNAATPDYHRQVVDLADRTVGEPVGTGVRVRGIRQLADGLIDTAVAQNATETAGIGARLASLQQIQASLSPQQGSIQDQLSGFFNQLDQLSAQPGDPAQRRVTLGAASNLTGTLNSLSNDLSGMGKGLDDQMKALVGQINTLAPQVAQLNQSIQQATIQGISANDLKDQRSQLLGQLGQFMDLRVVPQDNGAVTVIAGGAPLIVGSLATALEFTTNSSGDAAVRLQGTQTDLEVSGGQLGAALQVRNGDLKGYQQQLDTLAQSLIRSLDGVNATGLGVGGPQALLVGHRAVNNANVPLALAGLAFPPTAGTLSVSVTDLATGQRTLKQVAVDPATQSLKGFAAAFNAAVGNAQAVVDPQTNTLRIIAQPGYGVDFAGRLPSAPQNSTLSGTATAALQGSYTGAKNDTYTFRMAGSGQVGVTPGLAINVRDGSGNLVTTLPIGQGYEPGSNLPAVNGVVVQMGAGTVNAGDQFQTAVVGQPDTAGVLTALGVNTLFSGSNATDIAVRPDLLSDPRQLATGLTGAQGDNGNLSRLSALQDKSLLGNGTQTFSQYYANMAGTLGGQVQSLTQQQSAKQALGQNLTAQQQSVSGVDNNEELLHLLQFQRGFQMSSEYLSVVNQTLDELANIIK